MNTKAIINKIIQKLQDETYTRIELLADINNAQELIASIYSLPFLQRTANIVTSTEENIVLPVDYLANVYRVENITTSTACKIVYNFKQLAEMFDGLGITGDVTHIAVENSTLYFRKKPATNQTLKVYYIAKPTVLEDTALSIPDCIPAHLHDLLLVSYVLYDKFSEIEDGIERKHNTQFYWQRFKNGFNLLAAFYPSVSDKNIYQRFLQVMRPVSMAQQVSQAPHIAQEEE
jgi:hypothetical protein